MGKLVSLEELIEKAEVEFESFIRYKTPLTIVVFSIKVTEKELNINYLHKIILEFRNYFKNSIRKTDLICRHKNSLIFMLRNTNLHKAKGFINRFFESIEKMIKTNYNTFSSQNEDFILLNLLIKTYIISFSDLKEDKNLIVVNSFDRKKIFELFDTISEDERVSEIWELDFPIRE